MGVSAAQDAFKAAWAKIAPAGSQLLEEHKFHAVRRWKFDFAFTAPVQLAIEIDGRGRHQTVVGVRNDCEKLNEATVLGWRVMRFPATDYKQADEWAAKVLEAVIANANR